MLLLMWIMAIAEVQRGRSAVARKVKRLAEIGAMQIHPRDYAKVGKYWTNGHQGCHCIQSWTNERQLLYFSPPTLQKKMKSEKKTKKSVDQLHFYYDFVLF